MRLKDISGIEKDLKKNYSSISENQLRLVSKVGELINHSASHSISNLHTQVIRSMYNRQLKNYDNILFGHILTLEAEQLTINDFKTDNITFDSVPDGFNGVGILLDFGQFTNEQFSDISSNLISHIMVLFTKAKSGVFTMQLVKFIMGKGWQSMLYQINLNENFLEEYLVGADLSPDLKLIINNEKMIPSDEHMVKELRRSILSFAYVLRKLQTGSSLESFNIKLDKLRKITIIE